MIRVTVEVKAFHKVVKVFKGQVNHQHLAIKSAVLLLGRSKLPEVRKGAPRVAISCWRTAPTAELEVSVRMQVEASGMGCRRTG